MKSTIITSFALSMFTFMGMAKAGVTPSLSAGLPNTYEEASAQGASREIYENFTDAQKNCQENHSADESSWSDCLAEAERNYLTAIGRASTHGPVVGESIPVSTNAADSRYEQKDPDHKGFMNAEE